MRNAARWQGPIVACWLAAAGCTPPSSPQATSPEPCSASVAAAAPCLAAREPRDAGSAAPLAAPAPRAGRVEACGPFECRFFDGAGPALEFVLETRPVALGVGEAHSMAGSEHIASTARRFADALLPELSGRASHLVVELLSPDPGCQEATRDVRRVQEPVTAPQSANNQNDYVELGRRARSLGVEPFVLSPSCDEYRAITRAGSAAIDQMLVTIARVTSRMLRGALAKNQTSGSDALVIGYGGALHNDIAPDAARREWSYGPDLVEFTRGSYVELDLIVRELIRDTDVWRALPWYAFFDPEREGGSFLVMRTAPSRYVLFFPGGGTAPSAVGSAPSAVGSAPSAVGSAPSAVGSAPSATSTDAPGP
jgi:hypothetical protein